MEFNPNDQELQSVRRSIQDLLQGQSLVLAIGNPLALAAMSALPALQKASVGNFSTQAEAERCCAEKTPSLLFVTDELQQGYGIPLIKQVKESRPSTKCLLFLERETQEVVRDAINAHTDGIVFMSSIGQGKSGDFANSIHAISNGLTFYPQEVKTTAGYELKPLPDMTAKELDVLRALCLGLSNKAIAERLVVSTETVKTHVSNLIQSFGVKDRTAVVVQAIRSGL